MLRIGMLTSGGDCQALNAAMRGVVKGLYTKRDDVEIYGFQNGYKGMLLVFMYHHKNSSSQFKSGFISVLCVR